LRPGTSPPPVKTAMRIMVLSYSLIETLPHNNNETRPDCKRKFCTIREEKHHIGITFINSLAAVDQNRTDML
jgi:hypothetical protein